MRKVITLLVLVLFLMFIVGCGEQVKPEISKEETTKVDEDVSELDELDEDLSLDEIEDITIDIDESTFE